MAQMWLMVLDTTSSLVGNRMRLPLPSCLARGLMPIEQYFLLSSCLATLPVHRGTAPQCSLVLSWNIRVVLHLHIYFKYEWQQPWSGNVFLFHLYLFKWKVVKCLFSLAVTTVCLRERQNAPTFDSQLYNMQNVEWVFVDKQAHTFNPWDRYF